MIIFQWVVWSILAFITVIALITWIPKWRTFKKGQSFTESEIVTIFSIPVIFVAESIVLLIFVFIDLNKLHLLWIYPLIWYGITLIQASWFNRNVARKGQALFDKAAGNEPQPGYIPNAAVLPAKPKIPQTARRLGMSVRTQRTVFVIVGIVLVVYFGGMEDAIGFWDWLVLEAIAVFFLLYGGYLWAKVKGRHWAWMFTMWFWPLGLLILWRLKDRSGG